MEIPLDLRNIILSYIHTPVFKGRGYLKDLYHLSLVWDDMPQLKIVRNEIDTLGKFPSLKSIVDSKIFFPFSLFHISNLEGSDRIFNYSLRERNYSLILDMIRLGIIILERFEGERTSFIICSKKYDGYISIYKLGYRGMIHLGHRFEHIELYNLLLSPSIIKFNELWSKNGLLFGGL